MMHGQKKLSFQLDVAGKRT